MSLILTFPGSRIEPSEYRSTEPVTCAVCGWSGDAEVNAGEYDILDGIPDHPWQLGFNGDVVCHDCSLFCNGCGEDLLDRGVYLGVCADGELLCEFCAGEAMCP